MLLRPSCSRRRDKYHLCRAGKFQVTFWALWKIRNLSFGILRDQKKRHVSFEFALWGSVKGWNILIGGSLLTLLKNLFSIRNLSNMKCASLVSFLSCYFLFWPNPNFSPNFVDIENFLRCEKELNPLAFPLRKLGSSPTKACRAHLQSARSREYLTQDCNQIVLPNSWKRGIAAYWGFEAVWGTQHRVKRKIPEGCTRCRF